MPALPSSVIEPVWDQFAVLIPEHIDTHPLGCHNPRIPDRTVFDKLVQVLVLGASYERIADSSCSATTIRNRRDEWIAAGVFAQLEQLCLEAYDKSVGLDTLRRRSRRQIPGRSGEAGHQTLPAGRSHWHPARVRDRGRASQ